MQVSERFTDRARKVYELSLREALSLGHTYIGVEHILLGICREGESLAALVLQDLGVTLPEVRQAVINRLVGIQTEDTKLRDWLRDNGVRIEKQLSNAQIAAMAKALGYEEADNG